MDQCDRKILLNKYADFFTGIGGFSLAIQRVFPDMSCEYFSEIDKSSIDTYLKNFPDYKGRNLGDIREVDFSTLPDVDLVVGGSPCQDLSIAKANRQGLAGNRSSLFFFFADFIKIKKPKFFLLENVASMKKEDRDIISETLGVEPVEISSDFISPQIRRRLYWFNWDLDPGQLWDRGVRDRRLVRWSKSGRRPGPNGKIGKNWKLNSNGNFFEERVYRDGKANTLTTGSGCSSQSSKTFIDENETLRELTPGECEILQTFPPGWTEGVSNTQRYKQIGNAVTVRVVETILKAMK